MRIVYATDLHGSKAQYQQLLALALRQDARAVILGGDLLPIDGPFAESIQAQDHFIRTFLGPTLLDFSRAHPHIGLYWLHGNNDWAASLPALHQAMTAAGGQCLHNRIHTLENGYQLIGYANVPPSQCRGRPM
jgi:Icc-related predicted phosphoesterase